MGSSSRKTGAMPHAAGLEHHFDFRVDRPDAEASLAGVNAGERGGFGCVVGIDHGQQRGAVRQRGADVVIKNLQEVHVEQN